MTNNNPVTRSTLLTLDLKGPTAEAEQLHKSDCAARKGDNPCDCGAMQSRYIPETVIEWCPHCETEVDIPAKKRSDCPNCKVSILPCTHCKDIGMSHRCNWRHDTLPACMYEWTFTAQPEPLHYPECPARVDGGTCECNDESESDDTFPKLGQDLLDEYEDLTKSLINTAYDDDDMDYAKVKRYERQAATYQRRLNQLIENFNDKNNEIDRLAAQNRAMLAALENLVERDLIKDKDNDHYDEVIEAINLVKGTNQ